ncbi:hypothetical protein BINDI_1139 [Bifidobacterium [indicum] DSM 20214 = LMG 11587]|uniref:Uncharacterized protein n=1 Tax=Bifidobacterium [indicum] DSM 20214 = LMG 11587 TaxID=1341694 RepID=A0A087VVS8_9BIFI|nr:hypothetical protein [Bifidobacterium indicum]AIC92401.1 hypothetical protein BINDI_1139 [Bifidobacterium indicum LMG 11587 = DSM 20214]
MGSRPQRLQGKGTPRAYGAAKHHSIPLGLDHRIDPINGDGDLLPRADPNHRGKNQMGTAPLRQIEFHSDAGEAGPTTSGPYRS